VFKDRWENLQKRGVTFNREIESCSARTSYTCVFTNTDWANGSRDHEGPSGAYCTDNLGIHGEPSRSFDELQRHGFLLTLLRVRPFHLAIVIAAVGCFCYSRHDIIVRSRMYGSYMRHYFSNPVWNKPRAFGAK
jgi:hypothetical protein